MNSEAALQAAREADAALPQGLYEACLATGRTPTAGEVKMMYYTKVRGFCWCLCLCSVGGVFAVSVVVFVLLLLTWGGGNLDALREYRHCLDSFLWVKCKSTGVAINTCDAQSIPSKMAPLKSCRASNRTAEGGEMVILVPPPWRDRSMDRSIDGYHCEPGLRARATSRSVGYCDAIASIQRRREETEKMTCRGRCRRRGSRIVRCLRVRVVALQ